MKSSITYIFSVLFAFSTALLFHSSNAAYVFSVLSDISFNLSLFVLIPLLVFSLTSSVASLRRDNMAFSSFRKIFVWAAATTLLSVTAAAVLFVLLPSSFPVTSSAGGSGSIYSDYALSSLMRAVDNLSPVNPFYTIAVSASYVVPLILICIFFGYFFKPSSDAVRPAFAVMNSFSEVMMKISRAFFSYGYIPLYFMSVSMFISLLNDATVLVRPSFFINLALLFFAVLAVAVISFAIYTKGKENPFRILYRCLAVFISSLMTGSNVFTMPLSYTAARMNCGVQKKTGNFSVSISYILAKGGSAAFSLYTALSLYKAIGADVNAILILETACFAFLFSFISFLTPSLEVLLIPVLIAAVTGNSFFGAESSLLSLLVLVNGMACALDAVLSLFITKAISIKSGSDITVAGRDTL